MWLSGVLVAGPALAQFVPPVPPAQGPTAPYDAPARPPAPPPPPPAPPPEPELPAFSLVERDEAGKLKRLTIPTEEAALLKVIDDLTPAKGEKARRVLAERAAKVEQKVAGAAAKALAIYGELEGLATNNDMNSLTALGEQMRLLMVAPGLLNTLQTQQALNYKQFSQLDKAVKEYTRAASKSVQEAEGATNIPAMLRSTARNNSTEPMRALERMLARAAEQWATLKPGLQVAPESAGKVSEGERALGAAVGERSRARAMAQVLAALAEDQQSAVLSSVATPLPSDGKPGEGGAGVDVNK